MTPKEAIARRPYDHLRSSSNSFEADSQTDFEIYFYPSKEDPQFQIALEVSKFHVDFAVLECIWIPEFLEDGRVAWGWQRVGDTLMPMAQSDESTELYVRGFIKWDHCSHFYFGEKQNPGYLHLCGPEGIKLHADLLMHLHEVCIDRMGDRVLK